MTSPARPSNFPPQQLDVGKAFLANLKGIDYRCKIVRHDEDQKDAAGNVLQKGIEIVEVKNVLFVIREESGEYRQVLDQFYLLREELDNFREFPIQDSGWGAKKEIWMTNNHQDDWFQAITVRSDLYVPDGKDIEIIKLVTNPDIFLIKGEFNGNLREYMG